MVDLLRSRGYDVLTSYEAGQANQKIPEVLDFLIKSPIPQDIVNFKVSQQAQIRLQFLLDKNRESTLNQMEIAELDVYEQLEHLMILLKARAYSEI